MAHPTFSRRKRSELACRLRPRRVQEAKRVVLEIVLSTVAFFRGDIPREIALRNCSLPMRNSPKGAFSALYGEQGKQNGFMAARQYAATENLQYTVVDILVELDAQNRLVMQPEDLPKYDFLNFSRMSTGLRSQASQWFAEAVAAGSISEVLTADMLDRTSAKSAIESWPLLVDAMIARDDCRHLKVIAYQAATSLSARPLTVGSIPFRHWGAIRSATCRLNPNVRILLTLSDIAA